MIHFSREYFTKYTSASGVNVITFRRNANNSRGKIHFFVIFMEFRDPDYCTSVKNVSSAFIEAILKCAGNALASSWEYTACVRQIVIYYFSSFTNKTVSERHVFFTVQDTVGTFSKIPIDVLVDTETLSSDPFGVKIYTLTAVLPPDPCRYLLPVTQSARYAYKEVCYKAQLRSLQGYFASLGGGFAALRYAKPALQCALQLRKIATQLNDQCLLNESFLYCGYCALWSKKRTLAKVYFKYYSRQAETRQQTEKARAALRLLTNKV